MAKGRDDMQPLGVCRRFFNFIIDHLSSQGIKRVALGLERESIEVPIEEGSSSISNHVKKNTNVRRLSNPNGEVVIEFRHIETLENASPEQNGLIVDDDDRKLVRKGVTRKEPRRHPESAPTATNGRMVIVSAPKNSDAGFPVPDEGPREIKQPPAAPETGLKRMIPVRESAGNGEKGKKNKQEPKDIPIHQPTTSANNQDTAALYQRLPQRTESNINEKADAFIRSRKENLRQALKP